MNKRADTIRTLFATPAPALSSPDAPLPNRIPAGSIRSVKDTFSEVERENDQLRQKIDAGELVVEIDPDLIDPSPIADRFPAADDESFRALKASIAERGQEIPVLLRPHPHTSGRYQSAYGHRRIRAARDLRLPVKALVRTLTDEQLAIAQGIENASREDLSFIERANFAMRVEDAGHSRAVVQSALAIDRAEASKLVAVARTVAEDLIEAIGKAPKIGRGRWLALAELLKEKEALSRCNAATADPRFQSKSSDDRFLAVYAEAARPSTTPERETALTTPSGANIGRVRVSQRSLRLSLDKGTSPEFAQFLVEQIPLLFDAFTSRNHEESPED